MNVFFLGLIYPQNTYILIVIDDDDSDEETDDDGDYGLIDPEAAFDEPSAAKKKPSRDAISTGTNSTELTVTENTLNGTKVETTTKKKVDDDDEVNLLSNKLS